MAEVGVASSMAAAGFCAVQGARNFSRVLLISQAVHLSRSVRLWYSELVGDASAPSLMCSASRAYAGSDPLSRRDCARALAR